MAKKRRRPGRKALERKLREAGRRWKRWARAAERTRAGGKAHKKAVRYRSMAARRIAEIDEDLGAVSEEREPPDRITRKLLDVVHDLGPEEADVEAEGVEFEMRAESEGDTGGKK